MMHVRIYHNVSQDELGRSLSMLDGYTEGDPLVLVAEYDAPTFSTAGAIDAAWRVFNVGDDPEFGIPDPTAVEYRKRGNRSLSVGDVVEVEGDFYAIDNVGQRLIDEPTHVIRHLHGTNPMPRSKVR